MFVSATAAERVFFFGSAISKVSLGEWSRWEGRCTLIIRKAEGGRIYLSQRKYDVFADFFNVLCKCETTRLNVLAAWRRGSTLVRR